MGRPFTQVDSWAARLAALARREAKARGISNLEAFAFATKSIPRVANDHRTLMFEGFSPTDERLDEIHREGRLRTLRLDLEAALFHLDACCSPSNLHSVVWPMEGELKALNKLLGSTMAFLLKKTPLNQWKGCERISAAFPKLHLCKRLAAFVNRIADGTPPRPFGVLVNSEGAKDAALTEAFFAVSQSARNGRRDPATVDWLQFEPLLRRYQNAVLAKSGKDPRPILWPRGGNSCGPPQVAAYVSWLELERADLLWLSRFQGHFATLLILLEFLENPDLFCKLASFYAGSFNQAEDSAGFLIKLPMLLKRRLAAERKARSRKKSREKSVTERPTRPL